MYRPTDKISALRVTGISDHLQAKEKRSKAIVRITEEGSDQYIYEGQVYDKKEFETLIPVPEIRLISKGGTLNGRSIK